VDIDTKVDVEAPAQVVAPAPDGRARTWFVAGLALATLGYLGLFFAGGEAARFAGAGLTVLPFLALALLAYGGTRNLWARALALAWLAVVTAGLALIALLFTGSALLPPLPATPTPGRAPTPLPPGALAKLLLTFAGVGLGVLAGWLCFVPALRRALARWLPLDPRSFVHATALVMVVSATLVNFVPLLVLGAPPFLLTIANQGTANLPSDLRDQLYWLLWLVPAAVLAVGFPLVRDWRGALVRLGLVRPTRRQVILALALAIGLAVGMTLFDAGVSRLFEAAGWPQTNADLLEKLFAAAISPLGALTLGVTAGLGEELAVRGVLQPRLGILLSNLFFTSFHAYQYGFDALLTVFLVGLVLGIVRRRTNTTTSAIIHGVYDAALAMLAVLHAPGF
jgi:membrane protease YdiL (CAAX protease family)